MTAIFMTVGCPLITPPNVPALVHRSPRVGWDEEPVAWVACSVALAQDVEPVHGVPVLWLHLPGP